MSEQALLFLSDRVPGPRLLRELFVDRAKARQVVAESVREAVTSPPDSTPPILAITGPSRAGKSHLLHCALSDLNLDELGVLRFDLNVASSRTARETLITLLQLLWKETYNRGIALPDSAAAVPALSLAALLEWADAYYRGIEPLLQGGTTEVAFRFARAKRHKLANGLALGFKLSAPWFGEVTVGGDFKSESEDETSWSQSVTVGILDADALADLLLFFADLAVVTGITKHILVTADDFDLLGEEAGIITERDKLYKTLQTLSGRTAITVLATMRLDFFQRYRYNHLQIADVARPLSPEELAEVYDRHVSFLAAGEGPFSAEDVRKLAARPGQRVGTFLAALRSWYQARRMTELPPTLDQFEADELNAAEQTPGFDLVRQAARSGSRLTPEDSKKIQMSVLYNQIVLNSDTSTGSFEINPNWLPLILGRMPEA